MQRGKVLALLLVALAGCDRTDLFVYSCPQPDEDHKDANGAPDPCHRNDPDAGIDLDAGNDADASNDADAGDDTDASNDADAGDASDAGP